jgi:hypothetical protein
VVQIETRSQLQITSMEQQQWRISVCFVPKSWTGTISSRNVYVLLLLLVQVENYDSEAAQTIELPDASERAAIAADPLASLERKTVQAQAAAEGKQQLVRLAVDSNAKHKDEFALNKQLRAKLRASKKVDAHLDKK